MSPTQEAWKRLGELLTERRVQISPEYRNRLKFVNASGLHERLVSDLERGRRDGYRDTSLQAVEIAYRLKPGSIERFLAGEGELDPAEPVIQVSQVEFTTPEPPPQGVRVERYDERRLHADVIIDTDVTMDEAVKSLGRLSDNERATVAMLRGMEYAPAEVAGAVLMLRELAARRGGQGPVARKNA